MDWIYIVAGIVLVLLLFAAAFAFMSDPQEVDAEESSSVRGESAEARARIVAREKAQAEAARVQELKETRESPGDDFM